MPLPVSQVEMQVQLPFPASYPGLRRRYYELENKEDMNKELYKD
jgi:hypothetical protein